MQTEEPVRHYPFYCGELRRARLGGVEARSLYPSAFNNHTISITEASTLIRIHTATNTPDTLVEGLTDAERDAIAEAHTPDEGGIVCMRRY